jgi:hypothetical protein
MQPYIYIDWWSNITAYSWHYIGACIYIVFEKCTLYLKNVELLREEATTFCEYEKY